MKLLNIERSDKIYFYLFFGNFLFLVIYLLYFSPYTIFYCDSYNYFNQLGRSFKVNGSFNLLNFHDQIRGLIFPLFNYLILEFSDFILVDPVKSYKFFSALYFSILSNILIPVFVERFFKVKPKLWQILLLNILIFIFWRGYASFPLTDFLSIFLLLTSIYFWASSHKSFSLFSGLVFAFAINLRPIYLIVLFPFAIWVLMDLLKKTSSYKGALIKITWLICGFFIGASPQIYLNYYQHQKYSPLVQTSIGVQQSSLYLQQLKWGMITQKYETNVGKGYPSISVIYWESEGSDLYKNEHAEGIENYIQYLGLCVRHPFIFSAIFARHVFNGMDIIYPTPYTLDVYHRSFVLSLLNYSVIFLFIVILFRTYPCTSLSKSQWLIISMVIVPSLFTIPTAMEVRFFLPVYLLIYSVVLFTSHKIIFLDLRKNNIYGLTVLYLVFIFICFTCSAVTYSHIEYPTH
jgi:hypothetical protein